MNQVIKVLNGFCRLAEEHKVEFNIKQEPLRLGHYGMYAPMEWSINVGDKSYRISAFSEENLFDAYVKITASFIADEEKIKHLRDLLEK